MRTYILPLIAMCCATPVAADITVRFIEGAPKDRFEFTLVGACATGPAILSLDLAPAPSGLVFDVTGSGAGVEVFQPFEMVAGGDQMTAAPQVTDGDTGLSLEVASLIPTELVAFTIDIDNTIGRSATVVTGSEISGATAQVVIGDWSGIGTFGPDARATIPYSGCLS